MTTPLDSSTHNTGASLTTSQIYSSPNASFDLTATTTTTTTTTSTHQIQAFPPPQTFTFLPQLYTLISHLTPLQPSTSSQHPTGTPSASTTTTTRASRSPTLTRRLPDQQQQASSSADTGSLTQPTRSRDGSIELKDLPALVYPLRQQIAQAKVVVKGLPDVGRTVTEQEREIRELEARIAAVKARVGLLGMLAEEGNGREEEEKKKEKEEGADVVMEGVEGGGET